MESEQDNSTNQEEVQSEETLSNDPRFKDPEQIYKSYREIESEMGKIRAQLKEKEESARLADETVQALMAERDIDRKEAEGLLREETRKLLEKNAPKIEKYRESESTRDLRLKVDKIDLLEEFPEAKSVISNVMEVARKTGESLQDVYRKNFKDLVERSNNRPTNQPLRQANRTADEDEDESQLSTKKSFESISKGRTQDQRRVLATELIRKRMFGK